LKESGSLLPRLPSTKEINTWGRAKLCNKASWPCASSYKVENKKWTEDVPVNVDICAKVNK